MSLHLSHPDTPIAISAHHEQEWQNEHDPFDSAPDYYKTKARHLHFTWNDRFLAFRDIAYGPLPEVKLGEGRFSKEGVRYRQLYSPNPRNLVFKIPGDQFINSAELNSPPSVLDFTICIAEDECPDGALIDLACTNGESIWKIVRNSVDYREIVACNLDVEFGKPTEDPESRSVPQQTSLNRPGSVRRLTGSVTGSVRGLMRKLTGKGKKN